MNGELPQGWLWAKMLDFLDYEGGSQPPKKEFIFEPRKGYVRLVQIRDFGDKPFPTYVPDSKRLKKVTRDDLLLARYGGSSGSDSLGRICAGLEGAYNVALAKLIFPRDLLEKEYVRYLFLGPWFREKVSQNSRSCQTGFNREDVEDIEFPIAPHAEQQRIVAKVQKVLGRVDICQQRLAKVPALVKRFRQAVLAAACSGRLTADWRQQNGEAAPVGFGLDSDDLPDSWRESPLSDVVRVTAGEAFKKSEYSPSGAKLLQIANVSFGKIIWEQQNFLPISYIKSHIDLVLKEGDILMALNRPLLNWRIKVARLTKTDLPAILYQRVGRFSFIGGQRTINAEFLFLFLQSVRFIQELSERLRGTDQPYVNPPEMLEILFPVPPPSEQKEIVHRVESLFALADRLEARLAEGQKRVNSITQAILAKAFRGELVPTEFELAQAEGRSFESAEKLLDRIKGNGKADMKMAKGNSKRKH